MLKSSAAGIGALALTLVGMVVEAHTPPSQARIFFIEPQDGATVSSPVRVKMGIQGFGITPADTKGPNRHTAGHHHLLIDVSGPPSLDDPIPRDSRHIHFDDAETEAQIELSPGPHTLQLILGDEEHEPFDPPLISRKIRILVE